MKISHPTGILHGKVQLPSSKSISNRLLLMKAVAGFDDLKIHNLSNARDTVILKGILDKLQTTQELDVHDAGTVMRFLTAYVSAREGTWLLTGTERMRQRPVGALVDVLRKLGADIEYIENEGYPPLQISGKKLTGGKVEIDGSVSSQFISALLMIAPLFDKPLELQIRNELVSVPYVQMTLSLMEAWGAEYEWKGNIISVKNIPYKRPGDKVFVESDWSAASYFYSFLLLAKGGELEIPFLEENSLQGDRVCAQLYERLGVTTEFRKESVILKKTTQTASSFSYDFLKCPDIAQTLAVSCAAKNIPAKLDGLKTLSIKETDRILALKKELGKIGCGIASSADSVKIPQFNVQHSTLNICTYHDHRMAMSFAPLALVLDEIEVDDAGVVNKSFPYFWEELKKLGFKLVQ